MFYVRLSIKINGSAHGFFGCGRKVRQGDLLLPLLFYLAEDVLSRGIAKLVQEKKLLTISSQGN